MLGQRRRRLTYINPALSILQREHIGLHWPKVFLMLGLRTTEFSHFRVLTVKNLEK